MDKEEIISEPSPTRWVISLDWLQQNNRAIAALLRDYLCPRCARQLGARAADKPPEALMAAIHDCCSHRPDFIHDRLPILESIFRFFLLNGNQPCALEELGSRLSEFRSGDPYRTSPEVLGRLLKNDRYYGLQEVIS